MFVMSEGKSNGTEKTRLYDYRSALKIIVSFYISGDKLTIKHTG